MTPDQVERLLTALEAQTELQRQAQLDARAHYSWLKEVHDAQRRDSKRAQENAERLHVNLQLQAERNRAAEERAQRAEERAIEQWEYAKGLAGIKAPDYIPVPPDDDDA